MDRILDLFKSNPDRLQASLDECGISNDFAQNDLDALLTRVEKELNVFPFSAVGNRWLRLYTDVRLLRAQKLLETLRQGIEINCEKHDQILSDVVSELDYALIVAGAGNERRRELIHSMLTLLAKLLIVVSPMLESENEDRPAKRRRLQESGEGKQIPSDLSPLPVIAKPIRRSVRPNLTWFEEWANRTRRPLVLEGILDHWPALQQWKDPKYWLAQTLGGRRLVPIEIGQSYHDEGWKQQIMPFREFLNRFVLAADGEREEVGYLAQHDLFGQVETLRKDFTVPDLCYCEISDESKGNYGGMKEESEQPEPDIHQNVWFGGRTVSPLHHDPYHNILCQVHGTKYIRLYSPKCTKQLYPKSKTEPAPHATDKAAIPTNNPGEFGEQSTGDTVDVKAVRDDSTSESTQAQTIDMSNNSSVDIFAMELSPHEDWDEKWPGISKVPYRECILREGEALYIPKGWWHYVRALSSSGISISFWWG